MSRRRNKSQDVKVKGQAFTMAETGSVEKALGILYRRSLFHLVEPQFPRPTMAEVWYSFIEQAAWEHMAAAQAMMILPANTWQYFKFEADCEVPGSACKVEVHSKLLMPDLDKLPVGMRTEAQVPEVYGAFARAAQEHRAKWSNVLDTFRTLNLTTTRLTAAFHWPCAGALMQIGGAPRNDLSDVTRPSNISGALAVKLRETNAFVIQHTMLPPIDSERVANYEGDEDTGLAARLVFSNTDETFGNVIWPLRDND